MRIWYDTYNKNPAWAIKLLADGDTESVDVCDQIVAISDRIDPRSDIGAARYLIQLDQAKVYGKRIAILHKRCGGSIIATCTVLRAHDLGMIDENTLNKFIDEQTELPILALNQAIRDFLLGHFANLEEKL